MIRITKYCTYPPVTIIEYPEPVIWALIKHTPKFYSFWKMDWFNHHYFSSYGLEQNEPQQSKNKFHRIRD